MDNEAAAALQQLAQDYWEGILRRNPTTATFYSDYRYNDRLPDVGPAGRADEEADLRAVLARLEQLRDAQVDVDDRITRDMLSLAAQAGLDSVRLRFDQMAVDQLDGPQVWLPQLPTWHPTDTPEHAEQIVSRYRAFGGYMDQYLANLRDGVRDGRTAPTIAVERVIAQLRALRATSPDASPMAAPAAHQPQQLADALRRAVTEVVYPAFQDLLDFLEGYLTHDARQDPGVWAVTDGHEIYALLARQHTTTELSPDELHQIGLDDLAQIHQEMHAIMARRGAGDLTIRAFTETLTHDPNNVASSRDELIQISEQLLV
jgi:uncharacterized protein (DUF885 family)